MCSRYYFDKQATDALSNRWGHKWHNKRTDSCIVDVHPSDMAPIIKGNKGEIGVVELAWGFPLRSGKLVINARCDTLFERQIFQRGAQSGRIAIPAAGFYEWNKEKEKYIFHGTTPLIYIAGITDTFSGGARFVIITTTANETVSPIHGRMPLILEENALPDWLFNTDAARGMMKSSPHPLVSEKESGQMSFFDIV